MSDGTFGYGNDFTSGFTPWEEVGMVFVGSYKYYWSVVVVGRGSGGVLFDPEAVD